MCFVGISLFLSLIFFVHAVPVLPIMCEVICLCLRDDELAGTHKKEVILASGLRDYWVVFLTFISF